MRAIFTILIFVPGMLFADVPAVYVRYGSLHSVPPELLYAVALTEAAKPGEKHPWPWTANIAGKAHYYKDRMGLYKALLKLVEEERYLFDVGIMQINWKWNAHLFDGDLWFATDPYNNVNAGAKHLSDLRMKTGSFNTAVALYHVGSMNTPDRNMRARAYCQKVQDNLPDVGGSQHE